MQCTLHHYLFLKKILVSLVPPQPTSLHTIYYCIPVSFYHSLIQGISSCINEFEKGNEIYTSDWLPNVDNIEEIVEETTIVSRKLVQQSLRFGIDFITISNHTADLLRQLYKYFTSQFLPSLPKVNTLLIKDTITYEVNLPTLQFKIVGINEKSYCVYVKLSLSSTVAESIDFITQKLKFEQQFVSIELCIAGTKTPLTPSMLLSDAQTKQFTLYYCLKRRTQSEIIHKPVFTEKSQIKTRRTATPILRDLWSNTIFA
ncbi:Uncharacterized protein QTN25_010138 [Entamoeba marina]